VLGGAAPQRLCIDLRTSIVVSVMQIDLDGEAPAPTTTIVPMAGLLLGIVSRLGGAMTGPLGGGSQRLAGHQCRCQSGFLTVSTVLPGRRPGWVPLA
jgi:hypothetical protein